MTLGTLENLLYVATECDGVAWAEAVPSTRVEEWDRFITAATPQAVTALIAVVRVARKLLGEYDECSGPEEFPDDVLFEWLRRTLVEMDKALGG